jgi:hypothetical protein
MIAAHWRTLLIGLGIGLGVLGPVYGSRLAQQPTVDDRVAALETTVAGHSREIERLEDAIADASGEDAETPTPVEETAGASAAEFGQWSVDLVSTETSELVAFPDGSGDPQSPQGIFIIVNLVATNDGASASRFPYGSFSVEDDDGRSYSFHEDATAIATYLGNNTNYFDDLQPGLAYPVAIVFDVPPDAVGLTLMSAEGSGAIDLDR